MASTGSSDVETEEYHTDQTLSPKKVGRAAEYPEFAIIWSYLENFCELLRFPELSLDGLEDAFNSHSPRNENCRQLEYLHKKLLVKLNRKFRPDKWEKALLKIAKEQNMLVSWDLENFGYDQLKIGTKLELFKMLLECQFDTNNKLKTVINKSYEADELRLQPFGHDMDGLLYWFHMDEAGGVRLYSTEEDEVENESWKLLASDLEELENVIEFLVLKSETNPKDIVLAKRAEEKKKNEGNNKNTKKKNKSKKAAIEEEDDNPCARCYSNVQPDSILLCDKCDGAYHTACLRPPLLNIPQGDWFCPFCQQLVLLERLKEKRTRLVARQKLRARQAKRLTKSGMNLSNILQGPGSDEEQIDSIRRSGRARKIVDYTFKEFDDDILDAVETDKKRLKLDDTEMNGHPTGKPAFSVERFYSSSKTTVRRRSRRLKDLDSGSDSDSKISDYEYDGSTDDDRPKRPERHVYLRRHIIEDDDEEDDDDDGNVKEKTNGKCGSDDESSGGDESKGDKNNETKMCNDKNEGKPKENRDEVKDKSLNDSQDSNRDNTDASSEKSGPSADLSATDDKETASSVTSKDDRDKGDTKELKKDTLGVLKSKPPPLERISPKVDPLGLDALGFGALASCFSNSERHPSSRHEQYSTLHSPSQNIRSPLRPDAGFSTDRMAVPPSPSSYQRVSSTDSRFGTFPPSYDQSSSFTNYLAYNQTNFSSGSTMDTYPTTPSGRQSSYPSLTYPGSRQYPGYSASGVSKRETSPSYNQPPPYGSSLSAYSSPYPSSDMTSRSSYYPSPNQGYSIPTKNPYPPQGYFPNDSYPTGMFYGNTGNTMQQGSASSWPSHTAGSNSYFPSSGMGQNRTGI